MTKTPICTQSISGVVKNSHARGFKLFRFGPCLISPLAGSIMTRKGHLRLLLYWMCSFLIFFCFWCPFKCYNFNIGLTFNTLQEWLYREQGTILWSRTLVRKQMLVSGLVEWLCGRVAVGKVFQLVYHLLLLIWLFFAVMSGCRMFEISWVFRGLPQRTSC